MRRSRVLGALLSFLAAAGGACRSPAAGPYAEEGWSIEFRGVRELSEPEAREIVRADLERFPSPGLSGLALEDAAWSLERAYRNLGYPRCRVTGVEDRTEEGAPLARLVVKEGPRVELERIEFTGTRALASDDLETLFEGPEQGLFGRGRWYVESEIESGLEAVLVLYRSRGYLDARLSAPEVDFGRGGRRASLRVAVDEGIAYRLRSVEVQGSPPDLEPEILAAARQEIGRTYSPGLPRALRGRCEDLLGRHGYADARARIEKEDRHPDGEVDLALVVEAGGTVRVSQVTFSGNARTSERILRNALEIQEGDPYDSAEWLAASRRLQDTDLFSSVRLDLTGDGPERTLAVTVEEVARSEFYVEPGYGSYERFRFLAGWRKRDLFGTGWHFDVQGKFGELAQSLRVGMTDPRFLGTGDRADAGVFANQRQEPGFLKTEVGGRFSVSHRVSPVMETSATYTLRHSAVSDVDTSVPDPTNALDSVDLSSVAVAASHDTRDDPFAPSHGHLGRVGIEYSAAVLGSELDFLRVNWTGSAFTPLWRGAVIGGSYRGGGIAPLEGTQTIPLQERYFNGGENTVRSFRENEIGPKDASGDPLGGEGFNVLSFELRQRLIGRLDGVLFYDTGNVVSDVADQFSFDDMEMAIGTGLRYLLPVGPIRLDAGFNPARDDGEDEYVIHLSVGMAF
jgi:outer membrane protein assembly complex protein YaeT